MTFCDGAVMPQLYVRLKPVAGFRGVFAAAMPPSYLAILLYVYGRHFGRERPPTPER